MYIFDIRFRGLIYNMHAYSNIHCLSYSHSNHRLIWGEDSEEMRNNWQNKKAGFSAVAKTSDEVDKEPVNEEMEDLKLKEEEETA